MRCAEQSANRYEAFMLKTLYRSRQPSQQMKEFFGERFLVQNDFLYPFVLHPSEKDTFIIRWAKPFGIGCSTETIHTVLYEVQPKVFDKLSL